MKTADVLGRRTTLFSRHSVFWRLSLLVGLFCVGMIAATHSASWYISLKALRLEPSAIRMLDRYVQQAEQQMQQGPEALQLWLDQLMVKEGGWAIVLDRHLHPYGTRALTDEQRDSIRFVRLYTAPISPRGGNKPLVRVPLKHLPGELIMNLPERYEPWSRHMVLRFFALYFLPILLSTVFCIFLYRLLVAPLMRLSQQTVGMGVHNLNGISSASLLKRKDELGALGRSLDFLIARLSHAFQLQQQLLQDVAHELRTPLSRLQVALESDLSAPEFQQRVSREVLQMKELADRTLQWAWLGSDQVVMAREPVDLAALWDVLAENAVFESGWSPARLQAQIPEGCLVMGNLDALAQALENILRNAIRHSPTEGVIRFSAKREGVYWYLQLKDQGTGVPEADLTRIFEPFARLNSARTGGEGFGLGLAIAQRMIVLQGGDLWAHNAAPGLVINIRLENV